MACSCLFSSFELKIWRAAVHLNFGDPHKALPEECLPGDITEPGKLDEVFDQMDADSDGKVTFDEFKAAMNKDSALQDVLLSSLRPQ